MDALTHFLPLASVVGFRGHCNQAQLPQADGVSRGRAQLSLVGNSLTGVSLPIFPCRQPDSCKRLLDFCSMDTPVCVRPSELPSLWAHTAPTRRP